MGLEIPFRHWIKKLQVTNTFLESAKKVHFQNSQFNETCDLLFWGVFCPLMVPLNNIFIVFMKGDGDHYLAYSNGVQGTTIHS